MFKSSLSFERKLQKIFYKTSTIFCVDNAGSNDSIKEMTGELTAQKTDCTQMLSRKCHMTPSLDAKKMKNGN